MKVYTITYLDGEEEILEYEEGHYMAFGYKDPSTLSVFKGPTLIEKKYKVRSYKLQRYDKSKPKEFVGAVAKSA